MTDPIADMLTRIRNASAVRKPEVLIPFSKMKFEIAKILAEGKWIKKAEVVDDGFKQIRIQLKYDKDNRPRITQLKRVSKPGRRVYVKHYDLPKVLNNLGIAIISTSSGVMSNIEARQRRLGGEVICEIY